MSAPTQPPRKRNKDAKGIKPSAPGTVEAWLDMLVSMLGLPKADRQRVRDELEDHLRSRIDDLLITGHSEPEALKQAASELGETADLARQLTHAHAPPRKRTYAMHAALFAIAGSIAAVGISLSGGGSGPNTVNGVPVVSSVPVIGMATDGQEPRIHDTRVNLRDTTLEAVIKSVMSIADRPVLVHWDRLEDTGIGRDTPIDFDVEPLPHHLIHGLLIEHFSRQMVGDTLAMYESDELYEISARSHFDQRSKSRQIYPVVDILKSVRDSMQTGTRSLTQSNVSDELSDVIQMHVESDAWVSRGGNLASISVIDRSLVVTAPERIHEQVASLLDGMRGEMRSREQSMIERQRRVATTLGAEHQSLMQQLRKIEDAQAQTRAKILTLANSQTRNAESITETAMLEAESERLFRQAAELESRIRYIQTRLIAAEYEPMAQSPSTRDLDLSITVNGTGRNTSSYPCPSEGMTVQAFLKNNRRLSVKSNSSMQVFRHGSFLVSIDAEDIRGPGGQIELLPGDSVILGGLDAPDSRGEG